MTFRIIKLSAVLLALFSLAAVLTQPAQADFEMLSCGNSDPGASAPDPGIYGDDQAEWASSADNRVPLKFFGINFVNHNNPGSASFALGSAAFLSTTTGKTGMLSNIYNGADGTVYPGEVVSYQQCPSPAPNKSIWHGGYITRNSLEQEYGNQIYAVGNGTAGSWVLNTAADSKITSMANTTLRTWSSGSDCNYLSCTSQKPAAKDPNRADQGWEARFYRGYYQPGHGYTANGGYQIPADSSTSFAQGLSTKFVALVVSCQSAGGCVSSSNQLSARHYTRATASLQGSSSDSPMRTSIDDQVHPTISVVDSSGASSIVSGASPWLSSLNGDPKISFTVNGSDSTGSGVQSSKMSFDSGPAAQTVGEVCNVYRSTAGRRCPATTAQSSFGFKASEFSNGSHSLTATVADADNNQQSKSYSFNIDSQKPGEGCGSLSASPPTSSKDSSNKGWVRSKVTVQGSGCDTRSGIASSRIEYQQAAPSEVWISSSSWGSASNLPSASCLNSSPAAAGAMSRISSCEVDTSAFADGTALRFRWSGTDLANNTYYSAWTDPVYTDNTAPTVADVKWEGWDGSAWQSIETGWTNATKTRLTWDYVSQGNGSPLDKYSYLYDSDVDGAAADGCVLQQPSSTWLQLPSPAVSPALSEDRSEQCRQGKHQAWLWIKDIAGNGAGGSPMSSFKSAAAEKPTLNYDSVPTPQSRDESWAASDTLAPVGFSVVPSSGGLAGSWTSTNSFTGNWTNPTITSIVTQAPILKALYKVGGGSTSGPLASQDIQSHSGCLLSGASCSLESIKAPSEGSHPVKLWLMDAAGNASLEQSAAGTINWREGVCVPTD